jgi:hypothetical protein
MCSSLEKTCAGVLKCVIGRNIGYGAIGGGRCDYQNFGKILCFLMKNIWVFFNV